MRRLTLSYWYCFCVAFRVGLGNHIARQIVGKGLRCAVGVGHLLQQAFGGVGTPKIIL